jgi:HlyD family secretion protein
VKGGEVVVEGPYKALSRDLADGRKVTVEAAPGKPGDEAVKGKAKAP